jgi:ferredoxin-thioredoxin reductase catalytic subunit
MITIDIFRKEGWELNPNDRVVNSILRMIARNEGNCPC